MLAHSYEALERKYDEANFDNLHPVGGKIFIEGVWPGYAPHNPTPPVWIPVEGKQKLVIAIRFEVHKEKMESVSLFLETSQPDKASSWHPMKNVRIIPAEDPFVTTIHGEIIVVCKQALPVSSTNKSPVPCCTVMYRGRDLTTLRRCGVFDEVNCVRPVELLSGDIGIFTRSKKGLIGNAHAIIEWRVVEKISDITQKGLNGVKPISLDMFAPREWGSVNEPHVCADGVTIGVVGHIASQVTRSRVKYAAMAFEFDPRSGRCSPLRIIATRKYFLDGPAKRGGLSEVIYPGGIRFDNKKVLLYAGTSDAEAQWREIPKSLVDFY